MRILHFVRVDRHAPVIVHHHCLSTAAFYVFLHAPAEYTVLGYDHLIARRNQIDKTSFHTSRTWRGHRHGQGAVGLECKLEKALHIIHQADKSRVEVADRWPRQRFEDAGIDVGRTGAHQGSDGWVERLGHFFL